MLVFFANGRQRWRVDVSYGSGCILEFQAGDSSPFQRRTVGPKLQNEQLWTSYTAAFSAVQISTIKKVQFCKMPFFSPESSVCESSRELFCDRREGFFPEVSVTIWRVFQCQIVQF